MVGSVDNGVNSNVVVVVVFSVVVVEVVVLAVVGGAVGTVGTSSTLFLTVGNRNPVGNLCGGAESWNDKHL